MARIIELIPVRDGKILTVKLKTQHGTVLRPVQRVYPLEIHANENCVTEEVAVSEKQAPKMAQFNIVSMGVPTNLNQESRMFGARCLHTHESSETTFATALAVRTVTITSASIDNLT
ncbi:hypothetical protein TNCV_141371 [Trichonephila clavipes]|nr:hypothetical protein TNCV_141371 [Trichonephila clavipes]